jgi:pyrroline-5-carboxylate reductase
VYKRQQEALKKHAPLVISVMAGITAKTLEQWLGPQQAVIRAMPNTPAAVQCGATGLFANPYCTVTDKNQAESILRATGVISWVQNEVDLASLTALSGSGPGYYFYFMEIMEAMAIKMGIPAETAHLFTVQTAYGAAKLALESPSPFAALRAQVSSGGGSTAAAIASMQHHDLTNLLEEAMIACRNRALELAQGS